MNKSEILTLKTIATTNYRVICVASEVLKSRELSTINVLSDGTDNYEIQDTWEVLRDEVEPFPNMLMLLATGQTVAKDKIFRIYSKSDKIYFFGCRKM